MKRLTIDITDLEWQAMADIVVDPRQWARDSISGKVSKCVGKVVTKEQKRLLDDPNVDSIPATVDGILESHFAQLDYKTRAERDAEAEAAMDASMNVNGSNGD